MILIDEIKRELGELAPEVTDLADALAIERSRLRLEELEQRSADPAFYNDTMIDKIVDMSKVDIGGNEIEGAKMQVLDYEGNIIDEWVSGKEPHKIKNLEEGKSYILHEEVSVGYYVKATDVEFEVTYDKETQHLELIDKIVDVTKIDMVNGEEVEGAELVVTDENGNEIDRWTSTKEPHHVVGLEEGKKYVLTEITAPYRI